MAAIVEAHETKVSPVWDAPAELLAGSDMALTVRVSCTSGCDLRGGRVGISFDGAAPHVEKDLVSFDGIASETAEFILKAPAKPGEHSWTAMFPAQDRGGVRHEARSEPFSFAVKPHNTIVQVWDVPSPLAFNSAFKVKVGVQCTEGCDLANEAIAIYDSAGTQVAAATLGNVPWSTNPAQSCAEVELKASGKEGRQLWKITFPASEEAVHGVATATFTAGVAAQPEHVVTVEVFDSETTQPVEAASVVLRPSVYRGSEYITHTDASGVARIRVPKGEYRISASQLGYRDFLTVAQVSGDTSVKAELRPGSDLEDIFGRPFV